MNTAAIPETFQWMETGDGILINYYRGKEADVIIPAGVSVIGDYAFGGCDIQSVVIPDSVVRLGEGAFSGCTKLKSLSVPGSVRKIGKTAFWHCISLASVSLAQGVGSICDGAFRECSSLASITIPDSVTSIGVMAFYGSPLLTIRCSEGSRAQQYAKENSISCRILPSALAATPAPAASPAAWTPVKDKNGYGAYQSYDSIKPPSPAAESPAMAASPARKFTPLSFFTYMETPTGLLITGYKGIFQQVVLPPGITGFTPGAFQGNRILKSIVIPKNVRVITENTFSGCTNLEQVEVQGESIVIQKNAFAGCTHLREITYPPLSRIDPLAFVGCTSLQHLPQGAVSSPPASQTAPAFTPMSQFQYKKGFFGSTIILRYIGNDSKVILPSGFTDLGRGAFSFNKTLACVTIPKNISSIDEDAFRGCENLSEVIFEKGCEASIGKNAFAGCKSLRRIVLPEGCRWISDGAFSRCENLEEVQLPCGLYSVGKSAFECCTSLTNINFPKSLTTIGKRAFYRCSSLEKVTITAKMACIENETFYGCTGLKSFAIKGQVTGIDDSVFEGCTALSDVQFQDDLYCIGNRTFYGCRSLTSVTIPGNVHSIYEYAFAECCHLQDVMILDGGREEKAIHKGAFSHIDSRAKVRIPPSVTEIHDGAFAGTYVTISAQAGSFADSFAISHRYDREPYRSY